jgi:ApbE superfamily uncharacterized protein (UPF0280 family)
MFEAPRGHEMTRLRVAWLPDGKRLHLQNGALNLILQAFGPPSEVGLAYNAAVERARALATELVEDLPRLQSGEAPQTTVGRRAAEACAGVPGALGPVTALSGAVADEVLAAMVRGGQLDRGFVNNRGAVALHLEDGQSITPNATDWSEFPRHEAKVAIRSTVRTRALAGAGWRFDGLALGYVDRIYTAARSSAVAEAAMGSISARMLPAAGAQSVPATLVTPQSVLGSLAVYPPRQDITGDEAAALVAQGGETAEALFAAGIITLAVMTLEEAHFLVSPPYLSLRSMLSLEA